MNSSPTGHTQAVPHYQEGFVRNGDVQVHYRAYGAGPLLIFQHGFPDNAGTFAAQVAEFAKDHLVVTSTLRGYPPSSIPAGPNAYVLSVVAADTLAILNHFKTETAIFIGHDFGDAVIQAFALLHPDRVTGLVLMNSPVLGPFINLVNLDATQQKPSEYTIPYISYQEGDEKNIDFVARNIRDPEWKNAIARYPDTILCAECSTTTSLTILDRRTASPHPKTGPNLSTPCAH